MGTVFTLLYGSDWIANRNEILNRIRADVAAEKPGRILLVPELISHDAERRLAAAAGDTASRFAEVLSFSRLARRVADMAGAAAMECMDNGGRVVAMAAAARQLSSRLKAYANVETKPEFLTELVDAVDEFKRCCISAQDLKWASTQAEGVLAQKLEELSLLLEAYDTLCQRGKRDPRDQMTWVLEQLEDMDYAREHVLYVDGFPDFTRQHLAVLEHFMGNSPQVIVSLSTDSLDTANPGFEKAAATAREILRLAHAAGAEVHMQKIEGRRDGLRPVRDNLFRGKSQCVPGLCQNVKLIRAGSGNLACQAAAQRILDLTEQGVRYRDIAVVCTDAANLNPALGLTLRKCRVPLYLAGTEEVVESGTFSTLFRGLEAAMGGFQQKDVLRYLRSALSPLEAEICDRVENYAVIWAVSGNRWLEPWTAHPQGLDGQWDEAGKRQLQELNEARALAVEPLLDLREGMRGARKVAHQVQTLYAFLEEIAFAQRLDAFAREMDAAGDNRSAQILNQLWEILLSALEQLHDVLGESQWDDENFVRLLKLLLSQYDVGTIPPVLDAVHAGGVTAMRCQEAGHLILIGADEGMLPGYGGSRGLLTDPERVALRKMGVPLTGGAMEGLQAEFADIYGVFCGAVESVTLISCDAQPSFIYRRLLNLTGCEEQAQRQSVAARRDSIAAGAALAAWKQAETARQLGLEAAYRDTLQRKYYDLGSIQPDNIQKIYGNSLKLSASQVDRQAECRLSYFLKYGLRAQERKEAAVDPAEFGTYVHAVLEQTSRDVMARGGFREVDLATTLSIAREHSQQYADERFSGLDSQRVEYLFRRNLRELEMVVEELWQELHQAQYLPHSFELQFDRDGAMPAIEIPGGAMPARLRGFVDRVDTWQHGGSTFFRVVDYKTGKKDFDYCDVFNGVGLQMLLYLFALEDAGGEVIGGPRVSAGVQYFPARAPYVSVDGSLTEEEAEKERKKLWKRSGLLLGNEDSLAAMDPSEGMDRLCANRKKDGTITGDLADRSQLAQLKEYIMRCLAGMVDDIASGNVTPNPYTRGTSHNACTFCPYGSLCHKDTVQGRRNYQKMEPQRFWEEIGKEAESHGREADN